MNKNYIAHLIKGRCAVLYIAGLLAPAAFAAESPAIESVKVETGHLSLEDRGIRFETGELTTIYTFSTQPYAPFLSIPGYGGRFACDPEFWRPGSKEALKGLKLFKWNGGGSDTIDLRRGERVAVTRIEIVYLKGPEAVIWKLAGKHVPKGASPP